MRNSIVQCISFPEDAYPHMDKYNQNIRTVKSFKGNYHEFALSRSMDEAHRRLDHYRIVQLKDTPQGSSNYKVYLNAKLEKIVYEIAHRTKFNIIGIVIQILTAIISAQWGRCKIHVKENWIEAAVLMTLQMSEPGTRKSSVINLLRTPFENFFALKQKEPIERTLERNVQAIIFDAIRARQKSEIASFVKRNQNSEISYDEMIARIKDATSFYQNEILSFEQQLPPPCTCKGLIDGATTYQLGKTLAGQGESGCSISAEGGLFESSFMKKGNFGKLFNRLHDQEPYEELSGRGNISLKSPTLSIISFVQPSIAREFYSNNNANETGATARFLPIFHGSQENDCEIEIFSCNTHHALPSSSIYDSARVRTESELTAVQTTNGNVISLYDTESYSEVITRLLELYFTQDADAKKFCVKLVPDARQEIENFQRYIQNNVIPNIHQHTWPTLRKLPGKAVRFALSIHALTTPYPHETPISLESMKIATSICGYIIPHIEYACAPWGAQAYSDAVAIIENLQAINTDDGVRRILTEGINTKTLRGRVSIKGERFNNALMRLEANSIVAIVDNSEKDSLVVLHRDFFNRKLY